MKTALITGASRGIGAAAAVSLAKDGFNVVINYSSSDNEASEVCGEAEKYSRCMLYKCDISDYNAVMHMRDCVLKRFGSVDVLVNNAGIGLFGLFHTVSASAAMHMYGINLFGTLNCTRAFLPSMINAKSGNIINIASVCGERGMSCETDYSASKGAIISFTKALAKEVGPSNIRVNCVSPGFIDTSMNDRVSFEDTQLIIDEIPLERIGNAEDVASLISFLAAEKSSYITGQVITADGGWMV